MIGIGATRVISTDGSVHMLRDTTWVTVDDFGVSRWGVIGATGKTTSLCERGLSDVLHVQGLETIVKAQRNGAYECDDCQAIVKAERDWTIAFRKPRANRFQRVTNWAGTWEESVIMAGVFHADHPELQVFYVQTADAERQAAEIRGEKSEDHGNILADSGKRIRMIDNGILSNDMLNAFAEKVLSKMGGIDLRHVGDAVAAIADTGREDLFPIVDMIEAIEPNEHANWETKIPTASPLCSCRHDVTRCYGCVNAFVVRLFRIDLSAELSPNWIPPVRAFALTDCE